MSLLQKQYYEKSELLYQQKKELFAMCNRILVDSKGVSDLTKTDIPRKLEEILKKTECLENEQVILAKMFLNKGNNLIIWASDLEKNRELLKKRLKEPSAKRPQNDGTAFLQQADIVRRDTISRLSNTGVKFTAFLEEEVRFFFKKTIEFADETPEKFKDKFYSNILELLSTEGGIRLIIKLNEDYKTDQSFLIIFDSHSLSWMSDEFCATPNSRDAFFYKTDAHIDLSTDYKIPRVGRHAKFIGVYLNLTAYYSANSPFHLTMENGKWFVYLSSLVGIIAHELIHAHHGIQGKNLRKVAWGYSSQKIPLPLIEYLFANPEEFRTIITYDGIFGLNESDGIRLTESLIQKQTGGAIRSSHRGIRNTKNSHIEDHIEDIIELNRFCKMMDSYVEIMEKLPKNAIPTFWDSGLRLQDYDLTQLSSECQKLFLEFVCNSYTYFTYFEGKTLWLTYTNETNENRLSFLKIVLSSINDFSLIIKLAGHDFRFCDLSGRDLSNCNLNGVDFKNANLSRCKLPVGLDLDEYDFTEANLTGVCFNDSRLVNVNFKKCDLRGVDFSSAELINIDFTMADLSNCILPQKVVFCNFIKANLTGVDLTGRIIHNSDFSGCDLSRRDLSTAKLQGNTFNNSDLTEAVLPDSLKKCKFVGAILTDVDLNGKDLTDADLSGQDLHDRDLSRCKLLKTKLTNANLTGCILPADLTGCILNGAILTNTVTATNSRHFGCS